MAKYNLQPNEVVLLEEPSVAHGGGMAPYTSELILTNLHLVLVKKGLLGNSKGLRTFPLNQIKVYNQEAQARLGTARNGSASLKVNFLNSEEEFRFLGGGKSTVLTWVAKINEAVTGQTTPAVAGGMSLPAGVDQVADILKGTLGALGLNLKRRSKTTDAPVRVAAECASCGAPVTGFQGQPTTCEYCGSAQQL